MLTQPPYGVKFQSSLELFNMLIQQPVHLHWHILPHSWWSQCCFKCPSQWIHFKLCSSSVLVSSMSSALQCYVPKCFLSGGEGLCRSGNTLTSNLWGWWLKLQTFCGKIVVSYWWSAVYSTESWPIVCIGFLCPCIKLPVMTWPIQRGKRC